MNEQLTRPIETITAEIQFYKQQAGSAFLDIGRRLCEAKAQLDHGQWLKWLKEQADMSVSSAERLMQVSKKYSNSATLRNLSYSKVLALLSVPDEERERFAEEVNAGELSVRELRQAIRDRDAVIRQREQERDAARRELSGRQLELKAQKEFSAKLQQDKQAIQAKLEELEQRPPETVTVDATDAQIAAAEQRGREQLQQALGQAKQEAEQVRQQAAQTQNQLQAQIASMKREADQQKEKIDALTIAAQENAGGSKTAQTLGEINGHLRAIQEADRRMRELSVGLDEVTRRRVMEARKQLLNRMLGGVSG